MNNASRRSHDNHRGGAIGLESEGPTSFVGRRLAAVERGGNRTRIAGLSDKLLALVVLDDQIAGRIADLPGESGGFHFLAGVEELAADLVTFTICLALRLRFVSYGCPCRVNRCRFTSRL